MFHTSRYRRPLEFLVCRVRYGLLVKSHANYASTSGPVAKLIPFKSISKEDLGESILCLKENSGSETVLDKQRRQVKTAKYVSFGSSAFGAFLIPYFTYRLMDAAADNPSILVFTIMCDLFIAFSTFTPLLLHFLTKRFPINIYFNKQTQTFTSVHYNFFLQKRALRFKSDDVVDIQADLANKKMLASLATIVVHGRPILMTLYEGNFRDQEAYKLLVKNVKVQEGHD